MLEGIFGNATAEKVLLYLEWFDEGYASEIASLFGDMYASQVTLQLRRFENAGLLVSQSKGRARIYTWNPRYPFLDEVRALLSKATDFLPKNERQRFTGRRRRPRRAGKPS